MELENTDKLNKPKKLKWVINTIIIILVIGVSCGLVAFGVIDLPDWINNDNNESDLVINKPISDKTINDICRNITIQKTRRARRFVNETFKVPCNISIGKCDGTYLNSTNWEWETREVFNGVYFLNYNISVCKNIGAVNYAGELIAYKGMWCKKEDVMIYCYDCIDGRCQYGDGGCKSGETCVSINSSKGNLQFHNSIKKNLEINTNVLEIKTK